MLRDSKELNLQDNNTFVFNETFVRISEHRSGYEAYGRLLETFPAFGATQYKVTDINTVNDKNFIMLYADDYYDIEILDIDRSQYDLLRA